jgi:hypothetical protein
MNSKRAKKQISIAEARTKGEKMFPEAMFHRFSKGVFVSTRLTEVFVQEM